MAILMVVSAIQFIGVACLMNHVILLLRPLKMKDWLLYGIKSTVVNKMNLASELHCHRRQRWRVLSVYPLISWVILCRLAASDKKEWSSYILRSSLYFIQQRSEDVVSHYSMLQTGQDTKDCVLHSAAFHHYREACTRPFHDIRLQLSQNQRYCTNIEKAQRRVE